MDIQKTGAFIQSERKALELTQKELAQKLGCTDKAVSRWETGSGLPDAALLLSLSEIFGVSVNEILLGERFVLPEPESAETTTQTVTVPQVLAKADQTVIDMIQTRERTRHGRIFGVLCAVGLWTVGVLLSGRLAFAELIEFGNPLWLWLLPAVCFAVCRPIAKKRNPTWTRTFFIMLSFPVIFCLAVGLFKIDLPEGKLLVLEMFLFLPGGSLWCGLHDLAGMMPGALVAVYVLFFLLMAAALAVPFLLERLARKKQNTEHNG